MIRIEVSAHRIGDISEAAILIEGLDDAATVRAVCEMVREALNPSFSGEARMVFQGTPEEDRVRREVQELLQQGELQRKAAVAEPIWECDKGHLHSTREDARRCIEEGAVDDDDFGPNGEPEPVRLCGKLWGNPLPLVTDGPCLRLAGHAGACAFSARNERKAIAAAQ